MQNLDSIPVFTTRNLAAAPVAQAKAAGALDAHTAPPTAFLGRIISQADMDILLARGRREGFGVQGEWQSDDYPCDWKLVKVWNLA